jgi:hypothetical protein
VLALLAGSVACSSQPSTPVAASSSDGAPAAAPLTAASRPSLPQGGLADVQAFIKSIPDTPPPQLDRPTALALVALPLACVDRPHEQPKGRGYLWESSSQLRGNYLKNRSFYGCYDWHSAANSMWMMLKVLKTFPDLPVSGLIREKLNEHLSKEAIAGEVEFFQTKENGSFERPYGWSWVMRMYEEAKTFDDKDAKNWATNLEPLAKLFAGKLPSYFDQLAAPMRVGTHQNTAFAMRQILPFAHAEAKRDLEQKIAAKAREFFLGDKNCSIAYEPSGSDFTSPCLEEASLMSKVLSKDEFKVWFDGFMPAPNSPEFVAMTREVTMAASNEELEKSNMMGAKAHLIGLNLFRARSLVDIANALPDGDPRVVAYRKLAGFQASDGIQRMFEAAYYGTHWMGTFALDYLVTANPPPPAPKAGPAPAKSTD